MTTECNPWSATSGREQLLCRRVGVQSMCFTSTGVRPSAKNRKSYGANLQKGNILWWNEKWKAMTDREDKGTKNAWKTWICKRYPFSNLPLDSRFIRHCDVDIGFIVRISFIVQRMTTSLGACVLGADEAWPKRKGTHANGKGVQEILRSLKKPNEGVWRDTNHQIHVQTGVLIKSIKALCLIPSSQSLPLSFTVTSGVGLPRIPRSSAYLQAALLDCLEKSIWKLRNLNLSDLST